MSAEYQWACMACTMWTQAVVIGYCQGFYDILFWDHYIEDIVERRVPWMDIRLLRN